MALSSSFFFFFFFSNMFYVFLLPSPPPPPGDSSPFFFLPPSLPPTRSALPFPLSLSAFTSLFPLVPSPTRAARQTFFNSTILNLLLPFVPMGPADRLISFVKCDFIVCYDSLLRKTLSRNIEDFLL